MTKYEISQSSPERPSGAARTSEGGAAAGRAINLSVFVSEALEQKLRWDELNAILDAMDAEHGPPTKAARAWAKRALKP